MFVFLHRGRTISAPRDLYFRHGGRAPPRFAYPRKFPENQERFFHPPAEPEQNRGVLLAGTESDVVYRAGVRLS